MSKSYEWLLEFKTKGDRKMRQLAKESGLLDNTTKKLSKDMVKAGVATDRMGSRMDATTRSARRHRQELNGTSNELKKMLKSTYSVNNVLGGLRNQLAGTLAVTTLLAGARGISNLATEFEQTEIAFQTMLGSAEKGNKLIADLNQFANVTPFNNREVFKSAKSLLAYNIEADKILPTLQALGDISSGVGKDKLPNLILAFGQVKAATRLTGMELRQFTEAGVPLLDELAKTTGKSVATIKEELIPGGKISFELVEKALFNMTREGGKFFNLMERQSGTFGGRISTLQGKVQLLGTAYGNSLNQSLRPSLEGAIRITDILLDKTKSANQAYFEQSKKFKDIETNARPLINRYKELSGNTKRNVDEQNELKNITQQLGDMLPGVVTKWDRFGKALQISGDAFERLQGLNKNYRDSLNKDATQEAKIKFQSARVRAEGLYRELNNPKQFDNNLFGLISKKHHERFGNDIAERNRNKLRALMGDESGLGEIGVVINEMRKLNGLRSLTAKEVFEFANDAGIKEFSKKVAGSNRSQKGADYRGLTDLFTKQFGGQSPEGSTGTDLGGNNGKIDPSKDEGVSKITSGGNRAVTINMGGVKFTDTIEINTATLDEGLEELDPKLREFLSRVLTGGIHSTMGNN